MDVGGLCKFGNSRSRHSYTYSMSIKQCRVVWVFVFALWLGGCAKSASDEAKPVMVVTKISTQQPSTTLPACSNITVGPVVGVQLSTAQSNTVDLVMDGFTPGESLVLLFQTKVNNNTYTHESRPVAAVDKAGKLSYDIRLTLPEKQLIETVWDVRVVHSRGVVCTSVSIPNQTN
jgi:hypothetical protein